MIIITIKQLWKFSDIEGQYLFYNRILLFIKIDKQIIQCIFKLTVHFSDKIEQIMKSDAIWTVERDWKYKYCMAIVNLRSVQLLHCYYNELIMLTALITFLHWANWNYESMVSSNDGWTWRSLVSIAWLTQHNNRATSHKYKKNKTKQSLYYLPSHIPWALQLLQSRNMQGWLYPHHPFCSSNLKSKVDGEGLICHPLFLFSTYDRESRLRVF